MISGLTTINSCTLSSSYLSGSVSLTRIGNVVFASYTGDFKNVVSGSTKNFISTIPYGFKPINAAVIGERNSGKITIWFNSNGQIDAYNYSSTEAIMNGQFSVCWITSDEYPS